MAAPVERTPAFWDQLIVGYLLGPQVFAGFPGARNLGQRGPFCIRKFWMGHDPLESKPMKNPLKNSAERKSIRGSAM